MSRHSFDPEIAGRMSLNAAVIFQNITFWIEKNQANRRNLRDGRYWTYNSISAFGELFPYLSEKQIRTALEKLVSAGLIIKGNFSDDRYDRTCWYALGKSIRPKGKMMHLPLRASHLPQSQIL
ncbi:bacteriophage-related protein [Roseobacter sp. SK209-2-6]|uniref:bacteriophage-related protein n=1 Tax=Roseobacter sp. SK209-2-6 TaxID=388739 RepID=UPI0000F3F3FA|nr:bacteriophage-related protein [Roseobacter sp. SK209-2-6]EBA14641.1 bacteriophage-related protein [Roseobacter sp. SK209-2-6]